VANPKASTTTLAGCRQIACPHDREPIGRGHYRSAAE
jgi:hypothetical protein